MSVHLDAAAETLADLIGYGTRAVEIDIRDPQSVSAGPSRPAADCMSEQWHRARRLPEQAFDPGTFLDRLTAGSEMTNLVRTGDQQLIRCHWRTARESQCLVPVALRSGPARCPAGSTLGSETISPATTGPKTTTRRSSNAPKDKSAASSA